MMPIVVNHIDDKIHIYTHTQNVYMMDQSNAFKDKQENAIFEALFKHQIIP